MVNAKLHIICGNCGCNNMFKYEIDEEAKDFGKRIEPGVFITCKNCSTTHMLDDNMKYKGERK